MYRGTMGPTVMKRVVALPGEKIRLEKMRPVINDKKVILPDSLAFLKYYSYGSLHYKREVECRDGYFVLGDFSKDSEDSRFEGLLKKSRISGRPFMIIWPWSRIGFVNP